MMRVVACALALVAVVLAGCAHRPSDQATYASQGFTGADATGRVDSAWPDLEGTTLTILDHGAFAAFDHAAAQFHNLTGATVVHIAADDAGAALNRAILDNGAPSADVLYGVDNVLLGRARAAGILEPYTPLLSKRVDPAFVFFTQTPWPATPVDHGYIAINWDSTAPGLNGQSIATLDDVLAHADQFVTEDPTTSSVGLGFLLATIATEGEQGWQPYWESLFEHGVLITPGWTAAYEQHFSAGYGVAYGGLGDKAIVASYTESPAVEKFFDPGKTNLATPLTESDATFHQVQTMAILKGTHHLAAAQAWIEFTLSDAFQELAAPDDAVYPVVHGIDSNATYGGLDPEPGSFTPATFTQEELAANLERWVADWSVLCERHSCR